MSDLMEWFKAQISLGNIVLLIFMAGGFYYTAQIKFDHFDQAIEQRETTFDTHIEYQFRPLRESVETNQSRIQEMRGNYQSLEKLILEQQKNEDERYKRLQQRLDYIINRLDAR